jgi:glycosyltransferase involved in cell wall biosynthesis
MISIKKPLISVIIPTFNRGWALKAAIDSVLGQDYRNKELIIVDDGSTDNTGDILHTYENRITVIRQKNTGVSAARNRGIRTARGSYIAFLDSDDRWLPGKLRSQMEFFNSHPDAAICQTEEIWIRNGVQVNPKKRHKKPSGMIFEKSLALCLVSPSAVMMKKSIFELVGTFDESLPAAEDYDLWLRISCRVPVYLIDKQLVIKCGGHADQLSGMTGLDKFRIQSIQKMMTSGDLDATQYDAALKTFCQKCAVYAQGCRRRGRDKEAEYYLSLAHRFTSKNRFRPRPTP